MVSKEYRKNSYYERSWVNKIYFGIFSLFEQFGFNYFAKMDGINFVKGDTIVKKIFEDTVYYALKSNTITKLCHRYGYSKNKIPKGIIRSRSKQRLNILIDDDELLPKYDEWEKEELDKLECSSFIDAVQKNKLSQLQANVQKRFESEKKYNVQKKNMIWVNDFSVIDNGIRYGDSIVTEQYRNNFCQVILDSVEKSCMNRIRGIKKYSQILSDYQKQILKYYLDQLLGKEAICPEEPVYNYDWLDLI